MKGRLRLPGLANGPMFITSISQKRRSARQRNWAIGSKRPILLEGANWTFLAVARYNSWDDYAKGEKNSVADTTKKDSPWSRLRDHADFHTDTLTDRIAP
jgi:hypothetical protein